MQLSQSEWIAVAILAGFLIYLAIKGKLANYWSLLTGGAAAGTASAASSTSAASGATSSIAGAAAGAATGALPSGGTSTASGTVTGTITNNGQTATTTFPTIPGTTIAMPQVSF